MMIFPPVLADCGNPATSYALGALNDKLVMMGLVDIKGGGAKNIQKVGFRVGTVGAWTGVTCRVSIQGISAASGPPSVEDGTIKGATNNGFIDIVAAPAANTWLDTGDLGEVVAVNHGDAIAVVVKFTGWTAGTLNLQFQQNGQPEEIWPRTTALVAQNGTIKAVFANVVLEFDDGTVGTLMGSFVFNTTQINTSFNSGSNPEIRALGFQITHPGDADGILVGMSNPSAGDSFQLVLYDGAVQMGTPATVSFRQLSVSDGGNVYGIYMANFAPQALVANHTYYAALIPTTTNSVKLFSYTVAAAAHLALNGGNTTTTEYTKHGAGAWTQVSTTQMPNIRIRITPTAPATGGGGLLRTDFGGGMQ